MFIRHTRAEAFSLIELLVIIAIIAMVMGLLLAAIQKIRDTANRIRCANNLHQLALAVHQYHDTYGRFPAGWNNWLQESNHDYRFWRLSWMAMLLPFTEQDPLWRQTLSVEEVGSAPAPCQSFLAPPYNWSNPWDVCDDGTQRYQALGTVVLTYCCPADSRVLEPNAVQNRLVAMTSYLGVSGPDIYAWSINTPAGGGDSLRGGPGIFTGTNKYDFVADFPSATVSNGGRRIADIRDGTSNTLMIGERPPPSTFDYGWWVGGFGQQSTGCLDVLLGVSEINLQNSRFRDLNNCPAGPYTFSPGTASNLCDTFRFWSLHSGGANFALADGSVRFLAYGSAGIMRDLSTIAGGENASVP
jgi:prepilin-type processing-associated H-X9-DG protein